MMINWYSIPPFIASMLLLFLAIFVYLKNRRSALNILLSLECMTSFVWLFSYSMMYLFSCDVKIATFWMRIGYVGVICIPAFCYHFVSEFLGRKRDGIIIYSCYFIEMLFVLIDLRSDLFINGLFEYWWGCYPRAAILHPVFLLFFISVIGLSIYRAFVAFIKKEELFQDARKREQIKYIFLAFLLYSPACIDFIPNYGLSIYPFGYIFSTFFLSIITYAIVRHQLMDIKIIIKKTLIFAGIFVVMYVVLASFTLLMQSGFEKFFANHKLAGSSALHAASWPAIILFGIKINVFSIPPFIVSMLTLCLGLFVYLKNRKADQNKAYLFLCLSVFLWLFAVSVTLSLTAEERVIDLWSRIVFVGVTFIPITFYHFIVSLLKLTNHKRFVKIAYLAGLFFMPLLFLTNLYISGVHKFYWGYYPKAGKAFSLTVLFFVSLYGNSLYLLYKNMRSRDADVQERSKIKYALIAFFIGSLACVDYMANYGYCVYPFGYIFIVTMLLTIAYAILRHQLLDVEVVIKKTLFFAGIFVSVYAIFAFFALLGQAFFERYVTANRWIAMIPSVIVVTIMLRPIENFLINITDKYLFQKKYDYKKLLKIFMSEVLTVLEMDKLIALTNSRLMEIMKIRNCNVMLGSKSQDAELKVPIIFRGQVIGAILLGKKKSDKDYTQEDLDMLQSLAKTLGIAISNAKLFDELVKAQSKMAEKDKMATIGTLAAGMAHEIRNPITTIRNFADYLPEKCGDNDFVEKFEKLIPREIDRVESIARSLLEFSSAEDPGSREEFAIDEPMKIVIGLLGPRYRTSGINILCDYKERHVIVANKMQLQDAFFNIMNYILAETQDGGKILMECTLDGKRLTLSIRIKDLFVPDQIIKDVFEPVSGLHGEKRGFGFNLFVAKQLLDRNNAMLKIISDKISGSEFRIDFMNASGRP